MAFKWTFLLCTLAVAKAQDGYSRDNPANQLAYNHNGYNSEALRDMGDEMSGGEIPGEAGKDYPIFSEVPETRFDCGQHQFPGYYADTEARCQVFHICQTGGRKDSFLCPNGTVFNQEKLVCDWWFNFDCAQAESFYSVNEAVVRAMEEADRLAAERKAAEGYRYNTPSGSRNAHQATLGSVPARPAYNSPKESRHPEPQAPIFNPQQQNAYNPSQNAQITAATIGKDQEINREYLPGKF